METDVSFADSSRGLNMRSVAICDSPSIAIETQGQGVEVRIRCHCVCLI